MRLSSQVPSTLLRTMPLMQLTMLFCVKIRMTSARARSAEREMKKGVQDWKVPATALSLRKYLASPSKFTTLW